MKKSIIILLVLTIAFLSGCSVFKLDNDSSNQKTLQSLGVAYSSGNYSLQTALCSGFITNGSQDLWVSIPISKRILPGQGLRVTEVKNAGLRTVSGNLISGFNVDLTQYINSAQSLNDGSVLYVRLKNENKWTGDNDVVIKNNTPIAGYLDVSFTIVDPKK